MKKCDELAVGGAPIIAMIVGAVIFPPTLFLSWFVTFMASLLIGWPILLLQRKQGSLRLFWFLAPALILTAPLVAFWAAIGARPVASVFFSAVSGAVSFWWLAGGGSPAKPALDVQSVERRLS